MKLKKVFIVWLSVAFALIAGKLCAQPDFLWSHTYGTRGHQACQSIIQTGNGGFALAGYTGGAGEFWLVRTDADGDSLWSRTFGGEYTDGCRSIIQTVDGGFALAGYIGTFGGWNSDFLLVKTDDEGNSQWSRTFSRKEKNECQSIIQTSDGGFALAGYTWSFGARNHDFWLVKTDDEGNSLWSRAFGGRGEDKCNSIIQSRSPDPL